MNRATATSMGENGQLPTAAATLYNGNVMHARMKPAVHRFNYKVFSMLIDLDRLDEASKQSRFFSVKRFNLVSFSPKDHGPRDGSNLREHVDGLLADKGLERPSRVLLLAYPRILGSVFNPLSVYYAYGAASDASTSASAKDTTDHAAAADGDLIAVIYEVRNTFGGLHQYVIPVTDGQMNEAGLRQDQEKLFYVSPFIDMEQHYHFRLLPPGRSVRIRILETDPDGPLLSATFTGNSLPMTSANLLKLCLKIPFQTVKILGGIHWEAFKIWRKRVRFYPRPAKGASVPSPSITQTAR